MGKYPSSFLGRKNKKQKQLRLRMTGNERHLHTERIQCGLSSSLLGFSFFPLFTYDFSKWSSLPFLLFLQTFRKDQAQVRVSMVFFHFTPSAVSEALPGLAESSFKLSALIPQPQEQLVLHDIWNRHRNAAPLPLLAV